ncbi:helix-turn-helix domain-containing protein [Nonomuraea mesophila]|uniref:Helix-turn-helix domain-containing protein n=1 Tax=Nonomuraea mesophila TaxID=2530382 RepID=A0A4R5EAI2_9ACTN|nr:helix-turn-helix domain-containing protein [Nonomuraea mesophila]TDE29539.1 helix-turn-helix domain-containing protein [Nonomuraea mesophila]
MFEWRSSHLPPADRFEGWCALVGQHLMLTRISSEHEADFPASLRVLQWGEITVSAPRYPDLYTLRTARMIRQSDPDQWWVALVCTGTMSLEQGGARADLTAGDLVLMDTSRPYDSGVLCHDGGLAGIISLQLPRQALPVPEQRLRRHVGRPVSSAHGSGALLAQFLRGLNREGGALGSSEGAALGKVASELATVFLAHLADATRLVPEATRRQALAREIKEFISRHLGEPALTPPAIAAAHNISVRHLHHVFQEERQTVGEYIRRQRLERCRADLADPCHDLRRVADIAGRWGLRDAASFNRAFKRAYGMPPGEYRRHLRTRPRPADARREADGGT